MLLTKESIIFLNIYYCKIVIKRVSFDAMVPFITQSTAASTEGNRFLHWQLDSGTHTTTTTTTTV